MTVLVDKIDGGGTNVKLADADLDGIADTDAIEADAEIVAIEKVGEGLGDGVVESWGDAEYTPLALAERLVTTVSVDREDCDGDIEDSNVALPEGVAIDVKDSAVVTEELCVADKDGEVETVAEVLKVAETVETVREPLLETVTERGADGDRVRMLEGDIMEDDDTDRVGDTESLTEAETEAVADDVTLIEPE